MRASTVGAAALVLGSFLVSKAAYAGDEAAAQALFDEAKKLVDKGRYAEACPKFAASNQLDRGAGTLIHLADCYEKNKQSATAWATYTDAASAAQAINRKDWEKFANEHAKALEKKLAHLTIKVDAANDATKTQVQRDGNDVSSAAWGVPIPVDTGDHKIEAKAPGKLAFSTNVTVAKDGQSVEVNINALDPDPNASVPTVVNPNQPALTATTTQTTTAPDADKGDQSSQKLVGYVVGGIGVAGIALGAVTGLMAIGKSNDAKAKCANDGPCSFPNAVDSADSAKTLGTVSTIGFIAGGVALAAGAVLVFTAPSSKKKTAVHVLPNAGPGSAGLTVLGAF